MTNLQVSAVWVTLADPTGQVLKRFYTDLLGQSPTIDQPGVYCEFQWSGLRLGIFKPKAAHCEQFVGKAGGMSLCLEVSDLAAAIDHLTALEYPPSGEIAITSHGREIYADDPLGNRLILHQSGSG